MKRRAILTLSLALITAAGAFDPAGPPPEKTVCWTANLAASVTVHRVDFGPDTTLADALLFLKLTGGRPAKYDVDFDITALDADRLKKPLPLRAKDQPILAILGSLADSLDAELVIGRGVIRFIPRPASPQAPARTDPNTAPSTPQPAE